MTKFKHLMIPVLAVATVSVALPAAAHSHRHAPAYEQEIGGWRSISQRKYDLDRRIDQGIRARRLTQREASQLKNELNSLVRMERGYMRNGLSRAERLELDRRYDRLAAKIRYERRDDDRRRR